MKTENNIPDKIESTFKSIDSIEAIKAPHFFKDKTMQLLFTKKKEAPKLWNWITPQLQLATLVCVVLINVYAINQIKNEEYNESVSNFATDYGLTTETKSSIFNL